MARKYMPQAPFDVAMKLLIPTETKVKGVVKKEFPPLEKAPIFNGSFKTYGGTENFSNDIYTIFNTAIVETWYRPDITEDCRICICETGEIFDIISSPENINMRHQYVKFKVQKVGGKV